MLVEAVVWFKIVRGPIERIFKYKDLHMHKNKCISISLAMHIYRIDGQISVSLSHRQICLYFCICMSVYTKIFWDGPLTM